MGEYADMEIDRGMCEDYPFGYGRRSRYGTRRRYYKKSKSLVKKAQEAIERGKKDGRF